MKMYIAVLDEVPDHMVPVLVAHSVLSAHLQFARNYIATEDSDEYTHRPWKNYLNWLENSFKKCVVRVNRKEFAKISALPYVYLGHENTTLSGEKSCAVVVVGEEVPNALKFAKLWKSKQNIAE